MPGALDRARLDLANRQLWKARLRLEGYIGSKGYHPEVIEMLGDVCWQMGDALAAGRFWFFTSADRPEKHTAIELFVRQHKGLAMPILSQLPKKLRATHWQSFPDDVQKRLRALTTPRRLGKRFHSARRRPARRSWVADLLAFSVLIGMGIFFLYCFCLGFKQVFGKG